jgi:hypothetical protein
MTAHAVIQAAPRAHRYAASTFTAWRLLDNGTATPTPVFGDTLAQVAANLSCEGAFGHTYFVAEHDTLAGGTTLHGLRIRRGKWLGRYADGRKVYPYHADPLFSVKVAAFDPVEPWRWTPDGGAVGAEPGFVEGAVL